MSELDEMGSSQDYMRSSAVVRCRCEECGYKWQVKDTAEDEAEEEDDTVSYDASDDLEPTACPMCGCSDVLTL